MSRFYSYLNSAAQILGQYNGEEPFASFLKKFFSVNKKFGSKDRKQVSHLCFCYFRLGKAMHSMPADERILAGLFLCSTIPNDILENLKPEWNEEVSLSIEEKWSMLISQCSVTSVFPWNDELSGGIDHEKFSASFFIQPDLFIRLRPGKEEIVRQKLQKAGIDFNLINESCLALPNASKIDEMIDLNREAVIQDYNSQRVGELIRQAGTVGTVWDCCAASGGKSIMAHDLLPGIELTVSDIRDSILINLKKRFDEAGIRKYRSFVADLAKENVRSQAFHSKYSLVIADMPCSGSGTWSRTPEQLYYFDERRIGEYAALQKKIAGNIIPAIEKGGHLLYITCSVFKKENEEAVAFLQQNFNLQLIKMETLQGYEKKADTLFAALLQKPL